MQAARGVGEAAAERDDVVVVEGAEDAGLAEGCLADLLRCVMGGGGGAGGGGGFGLSKRGKGEKKRRQQREREREREREQERESFLRVEQWRRRKGKFSFCF